MYTTTLCMFTVLFYGGICSLQTIRDLISCVLTMKTWNGFAKY